MNLRKFNNISNSLYEYYYFIVFFIYSLAINFSFIRVGVVMSAVLLFLIIQNYRCKRYKIFNYLDISVILFLIYNTLSIVPFLLNKIPIDVYVMEYTNSIFPIFAFYFFGKVTGDTSKFWNNSLMALFFCFVVGFYFLFNMNENYREFLFKIDSTGGTDVALFLVNFRSILGLTMTGCLSAICVFLSMDKIYKSKTDHGKILLLVSIITLLLTYRRAALYTALFAILWINYLALFKFDFSKQKLIVFQFLFLFTIILLLDSFDPDFLLSITERFSTLNDAVSERNSNWFEGVLNTKDYLFGDGLGRYGHKAGEYTDDLIPDGNYFRIFAELGIFGILIFFTIIFNAIIYAYTNLKTKYIPLGIVLMICLQAVGSNVFSFQLMAPIFWFSIGACSSNVFSKYSFSKI